MDYQCIKGFTLKNGKHFGVYDIITQQQYDKLPEINKNNFRPIDPPEDPGIDPDLDTEEDDEYKSIEVPWTPDNEPPEPGSDPDITDPNTFSGYGGGDTGGGGATGTY